MNRMLATTLACALCVTACSTPGVSTRTATVAAPSSGKVPLDVAIRDARDLGVVPASMPVRFNLTLAYRDPGGVAALLGRGSRVTAVEFANRFGPEPTRVNAAVRLLASAGLATSWSPGDVALTASGPAGAAEHFLGVALHRYLAADGATFYATVMEPLIPAPLRGTVIAITGLDNYQRDLTAAVPSADVNGVTPRDMSTFYDITPLHQAGLDGTGQTVAFLEWGVPPESVLQTYARKFTPTSPFKVQVHQDAANWGAPLVAGDAQYSAVAGEAALDIEIVHGIAPGATEIVYEFGNSSAIPAVVKAITSQFPHAIVSSSISEHECEQEKGAASDGAAENQVDVAAAAQGTSIFWASGDRGAYACLDNFPDQDPNANTEISVMPDASSAGVTAVGGTTAFLTPGAGYAQESAWGEPAEQWGSGGGVSTEVPRPSWQQAPGMPATMSGRGLPDVAANADIISGWDIISPGSTHPAQAEEGPVGGTSAAAPFWAAITALIDEDLAHKSLPSVGFADPALYLFAQSPVGIPAQAFHDVTLGGNLHAAAGPGWDMATGLGTPDVAGLEQDFEWYEHTHGTGT